MVHTILVATPTLEDMVTIQQDVATMVVVKTLPTMVVGRILPTTARTTTAPIVLLHTPFANSWNTATWTLNQKKLLPTMMTLLMNRQNSSFKPFIAVLELLNVSKKLCMLCNSSDHLIHKCPALNERDATQLLRLNLQSAQLLDQIQKQAKDQKLPIQETKVEHHNDDDEIPESPPFSDFSRAVLKC
jgi:hypothetical protein